MTHLPVSVVEGNVPANKGNDQVLKLAISSPAMGTFSFL